MKNRLVLLLIFLLLGHWSVAQGVDCKSAIEMSVYDDCRRSPGDTNGFSGNDLGSVCGGKSEDGGWFKFKAISNRTRIIVSSSQLIDMAISVYQRCDVEVECVDNRGIGKQEILEFDTEIGFDYSILVFEVNEGGGEFLICVSEILENLQSDCIGAEVICQDGPIVFNPQGSGIDDFENEANQKGCLLDKENQSAWYYFEIQENAPPNQFLTFNITPENSPDYDFAIYGPNVLCDSLGYPIRCSWADRFCEFCPKTGLDMVAKDASESVIGDGFLAPLLVQPGEGYFLLIDNYFQNATGFMLKWGGSAAPYLNCLVEPPCGIIANAGANLYVCEETQLVLNGKIQGTIEHARMDWTGNGAAFLDDVNIANPTLILPLDFKEPLSLAFSVKENDCIHTDSLFIINNCVPEPCPTNLGINLDIHPPNCTNPSSGSIQIGLIEGQKTAYEFQLNNHEFQTATYFSNLSAGPYMLTLKDELGCQFDTLIEIPSTNLIPELTMGSDQVVNQGEVIDLQLTTNFSDKQIAAITWTGITLTDCPFPCLSPSFTATNSTTIQATIQTLDNCIISDRIQLTVEPKIDIYIPSAFSPNGDGINDVFMIHTGSGISHIKDLKIVDRWGNIVFQATNFPPNQIDFGWNGRIENREFNHAVFVYLVEVELPDGTLHVLNGEIVLIQ